MNASASNPTFQLANAALSSTLQQADAAPFSQQANADPSSQQADAAPFSQQADATPSPKPGNYVVEGFRKAFGSFITDEGKSLLQQIKKSPFRIRVTIDLPSKVKFEKGSVPSTSQTQAIVTSVQDSLGLDVHVLVGFKGTTNTKVVLTLVPFDPKKACSGSNPKVSFGFAPTDAKWWQQSYPAVAGGGRVVVVAGEESPEDRTPNSPGSSLNW